jgi:hypothetical protein
MATKPIQTPAGPNQSFMLGNFQFKRIFQVANVSRVLQTTPAVLSSPIHPFTVDPATSYTRGFVNFKHRYDLFTMVRPFTAPAAWAGASSNRPASIASSASTFTTSISISRIPGAMSRSSGN